MSIASEVQRIKTNIQNAYNACESKGATLPSTQNSENLTTCINSISTGSSNSTNDVMLGREVVNGVLQHKQESFKFALPSEVTNIEDAGLCYLFFATNYFDSCICSQISEIDFSSLVNVTGREACSHICYNVVSLTSVDLGALKTVTGDNAFAYAFYQTSVDTLDLSSLETINSEYAFSNAFNQIPLNSLNLSSLKSILGYCAFHNAFYGADVETLDLSSLETINGSSAFAYSFSNNKLSTLDLSSLKTITGSSAFSYAFQNNTSLTSVNLGMLESISGSSVMYGAFLGCTSLETVNLDSLKYIDGSYALGYAFQGTSVKHLYFNSLAEDVFGTSSYSNQFNSMLYSTGGCTVHFPCYLESLLSETSDVLAGFRGTNAVILFDLHCTTLNFTGVTSSMEVYVDGIEVVNNTCETKPTDATYYLVKNTSNNSFYLYKLSNLLPDETRNIAVNTSNTTSTITFNTGVSGLDVYFVVGGSKIPATEISSGSYSINLYTEGDTEIEYFIDGGLQYSNTSGTLTFTNSNITQSVILSAAILQTFSQPTLSSNGTMGGTSFACTANSDTSDAYRVFRYGSWEPSSSVCSKDGATLTFYNPSPLNISQIKIEYWSSSYAADSLLLEGSNDNASWETLENTTYDYSSSSYQYINSNNTKAYNYYKITFFSTSSVWVEGLTITAQYKAN